MQLRQHVHVSEEKYRVKKMVKEMTKNTIPSKGQLAVSVQCTKKREETKEYLVFIPHPWP